ncbi:amidohydrolase [Aurantiacibacter flavus]|uniref:Amidohydrolase n=1 Tax=Aurantiacibacter flavus TaxID=3145232 RepID=A0ABV0CV46_9SPHN
MRAPRYLAASCAMLMASGASAQFHGPGEAVPTPRAEMLVSNARILSADGWAEAMAIREGAIIAIGSRTDVEPFLAPDTEIIDAAGRLVVPGLYDMHVHPMGAGLNAQNCAIVQGGGKDQTLATIRACAASKEAGQWVVGNGHDNASFGDTPPNRHMLDEISSDQPMLFFDISGHSTWANSRALEIAGIDRNTPDPEGGVIERGPDGEPTGILRESASRLVFSQIPGPTLEANKEALAWGLDHLLAYGISSFDDAGVSRAGALAYSQLADEGRLKQRVRGCMMVRDSSLITDRALFKRARFDPSCVKIMLDGVPTDGHTAALVEPYMPHGQAGFEGRERGLLMIPENELADLVTELDADGLTVKFHAAGDAAVRAGVNAIAAARDANGFTPHMHNVGHTSLAQMSDIEHAREVGATFEFSPYIWFPSPITVDIERAVGNERMQRWVPVGDALAAGANSVPGSDWPVTPSANPWLAIETLVTRQAPGGGGPVLGEAERISLKDAFDLFTHDAARSRGELAFLGTLETGKLADFLILDQNIFEVPISQVHQTTVLEVYIEGEKVFDSGE